MLTKDQRIALAAELQNDPAAIGYKAAGVFKTDGEIVTLLSAVRSSGPWSDAKSNQVNKGYVPGYDLVGITVESEYEALTAAQRAYVDLVCGLALVDVQNANIKTGMANCFGAATMTRTNFNAWIKRDASRAEALFGAGAIVDVVDVSVALGRG